MHFGKAADTYVFVAAFQYVYIAQSRMYVLYVCIANHVFVGC